MTAGSKVALGFAAAFGAPTNFQKRYKFKVDFDRMELVRGGMVVEPLHPGRAPQVLDLETPEAIIEDLAYYGAYEYPPEAFKPGAPITLKIWKHGVPAPITRVIRPDRQRLIWKHFEPYLEALEEL